MNNTFLFNKYLALLGVKANKPSFELLCEIVKAHLIKIPFENISKLLYKKQGMNYIPDLSTFLNGIEKYNFGGTCYSNNYYLYLLLQHIGFDVKLCGADMKDPDVHIISMVNIDSKEYIVDGGYSAPFFNPLPRDLYNDYTISSGKENYIIKPKDENGNTKIEHHFDGRLQHWYTAKPQTRKIEDFREVIEDSYADYSTFMNAIRITRFFDNGALLIKNNELTEIKNSESFSVKVSLDDIPTLVEKNFGIPEKIVKEAIGSIKQLKDIYD